MLKLFFLIPLLTLGSLRAERVDFKIKNHTLSFEPPSDYEIKEGFIGRDIVLLGPNQGGKRNVIFVEIRDASLVSFPKEKAALEEYRKTSLKWLDSRGGKLASISLNHKIKDLKLKNEYVYNRMVYSLKGRGQIDGDLFYKCSPQAVIKVTYTALQKDSSFDKQFFALIKGLRC